MSSTISIIFSASPNLMPKSYMPFSVISMAHTIVSPVLIVSSPMLSHTSLNLTICSGSVIPAFGPATAIVSYSGPSHIAFPILRKLPHPSPQLPQPLLPSLYCISTSPLYFSHSGSLALEKFLYGTMPPSPQASRNAVVPASYTKVLSSCRTSS